MKSGLPGTGEGIGDSHGATPRGASARFSQPHPMTLIVGAIKVTERYPAPVRQDPARPIGLAVTGDPD